MTMQSKVLVGIVALVLAGVVGTLGWLRARMQPRFPYAARPLSDADYATMAAKPGWSAHQLRVAPGVELRGLLRKPASPESPWVLFFVGNSPHMLQEGQQFLDALCGPQSWGALCGHIAASIPAAVRRIPRCSRKTATRHFWRCCPNRA